MRPSRKKRFLPTQSGRYKEYPASFLRNAVVFSKQYPRFALVAYFSECVIDLLDYCAISNRKNPRHVFHDDASGLQDAD